ncbi:MAG: hypothetical protein AABX70_01815 [Nanoarchaeota archaeon]
MAPPLQVSNLSVEEIVRYATVFSPTHEAIDSDLDTYNPSDLELSPKETLTFGLRLMSYLAGALDVNSYGLNYTDPVLDGAKLSGREDPKGLLGHNLVGEAIKRLRGHAEELPGQDSLSEIVRLEDSRYVGVSFHEMYIAGSSDPVGIAVYLREANSEQGAQFTPGEVLAIEDTHRTLDTILKKRLEILATKGKLPKGSALANTITTSATPTTNAASLLNRAHYDFGRGSVMQSNAGKLCQGSPLTVKTHGLSSTFQVDAAGLVELMGYWRKNFELFDQAVQALPEDHLDEVLVREPSKFGRISLRSPQGSSAATFDLYQSLISLRNKEQGSDVSYRHLLSTVGWALPVALDPQFHEDLREGLSVRGLMKSAANKLVSGYNGSPPLPRDHGLVQILNAMNDTGRTTLATGGLSKDMAAATDFAETLMILGTLEYLFKNRSVRNCAEAVQELLGKLKNWNEYGNEAYLLTALRAGSDAKPFFKGLHGYDAIQHVMKDSAPPTEQVDVVTKYSIK